MSKEAMEKALSAIEEVLRISDRKHNAWDAAKDGLPMIRSALSAQPGETHSHLYMNGEHVATVAGGKPEWIKGTTFDQPARVRTETTGFRCTPTPGLEISPHPTEPAEPAGVVIPDYDRFGYALAMEVLQSDLYHKLGDQAKAECDAIISAAQEGKPTLFAEVKDDVVMDSGKEGKP